MNPAAKDAAANGDAQSAKVRGTLGRPAHPLLLAAFLIVWFAVYWTTSFILDASGAIMRFGADPWLYAEIADGDALSRLDSEAIGRIFRFHPVTVIAGTAWMNAFEWATAWLTEDQVLRAMFALVGALGGYAAMSGFADDYEEFLSKWLWRYGECRPKSSRPRRRPWPPSRRSTRPMPRTTTRLQLGCSQRTSRSCPGQTRSRAA